MVILFASNADSASEWQSALARHLPELEFRVFPDVGDPSEIETAVVWRPPHGLLARLPNLKLIASLGAGVDHLFADPQLPRSVPIMRLVDPHMTTAMSEYVQLQVLRLHRRDLDYLTQQRAGLWRPLPQLNASERPVGVLGLGVLGADAAFKLKVLGFEVSGWSRREKKLPGIACHHGPDGLAAMLRDVEILICLLPLTPATEGILDARLFVQLPRGAGIINCARGRHVVEADLLAALDSGRLSAAVLDVFHDEPLPPQHPFWRHEKVVVTPHVAAATNAPTAAVVVADAIKRLRERKPIPNRVDWSERY